MLIALRAARESCDLPVVAQMSFEEDGRTQAGNTPAEVLRALEDAGADVVGANCSTGPVRMARVLADMAAVARAPLSAQPNAGWPEVVAGRIVYVSGPAYMAEQAQQMAQLGARILGGCCGTTPEHIRELARRLQSEAAESTATSAHALAAAVASVHHDPMLVTPYSSANSESNGVSAVADETELRSVRETAQPGTFAW
jgi:homocysteine S-methyltransferase